MYHEHVVGKSPIQVQQEETEESHYVSDDYRAPGNDQHDKIKRDAGQDAETTNKWVGRQIFDT